MCVCESERDGGRVREGLNLIFVFSGLKHGSCLNSSITMQRDFKS